ncbi:MAG: PAS domain-containing protein [Proteobacteria bacterium]|nr:PAS domain-containing protein [Pseudomonadota bacterium]
MVVHQTSFPPLHEPPERSTLSVAFEAFWRALPKSGLVPQRADFRPERAGKFLRHIMLCEAQLDGQSAVRMRLVGTEFENRIQRDVRGKDYLDFLPEAHHASAIESVREIVTRPCGLWQVMPVHYERGFAHYLELTIFPLRPGADGADLLLVLTQPIPIYLLPTPTGDKVMRADTALAYRFIDIGGGAPA